MIMSPFPFEALYFEFWREVGDQEILDEIGTEVCSEGFEGLEGGFFYCLKSAASVAISCDIR